VNPTAQNSITQNPAAQNPAAHNAGATSTPATPLVLARPHSVAQLFAARVAETPAREAYRYPVPVDEQAADGAPGAEQWRSMSWGQAAEQVYAIAAGLMTLGVRPEERIAISCSTRIEWILADLGIMCAGAAVTAVYPSTNAEETAYILADSGSRGAVVEDAVQLEKIRARASRCSPWPSWSSAARPTWSSTRGRSPTPSRPSTGTSWPP